MLDLGADEVVLRKALASLPLDGFSINISRVKKAGLDACDFDVVLDAEHENHDHDMAYLYGGVEECGHTHDVHEHNHDEHDHHHDEDGHAYRHGHCCHDHEAEHCHDHEHVHEHTHGHHHHVHRGLAEVLDILNKADLTDRARATAVRIFTILGQAEAKAHGAALETVHFHEVGAVDSIVDITAAVLVFLYEARPSLLWQGGVAAGEKQRLTLRGTLGVLAGAAVVVAGGLSLLPFAEKKMDKPVAAVLLAMGLIGVLLHEFALWGGGAARLGRLYAAVADPVTLSVFSALGCAGIRALVLDKRTKKA